jgi:hypothetical protein
MRLNPARLPIACAGVVASVYLCGVQAQTQNGSVKATFERHDLIGIFAADCGSQASKANPFFVTRVLDDDHVQRDRMIGPSSRERFWIIDQARELTADEIYVSGKWDNGQSAESVWRFDGKRSVAVEHSTDGKKVIAGGKWVSNGQNVPWLSKCATSGDSTQTTPAPSVATSGGCHTENYTFSAVLSQSARTESVSTDGAACFYKVAPIHPDQVQFTSASIVEQPSNGTFEQTGDFAFKYQPRPGFKGTDEYAIKVCGHNSQRAGCATITYQVTAK